MLSVLRSCLVLAFSLCLTVFSLAQLAPASEAVYSDSAVEWPSPRLDAGVLLSVSGPGGLYLRQEHAAGTWARFSLTDGQGHLRPDGLYKWELVIQAGWETESEAPRSGWFQIRAGRVVGEGTRESQPVVMVEDSAPQNSLYVDSQGRVGIGTSVPGAQLHLKGTAPALAIDDTRTGGREYVLRTGEDGSVTLLDGTVGEARWTVDAEGRLGIGTGKPTSKLTVDGYIESTKGFLVNGRPIPAAGLLGGGVQPLYTEGTNSSYFGVGAGTSSTGVGNSFFGVNAGHTSSAATLNSFFGFGAGYSNSSGGDNCFFGAASGRSNTQGAENAFFGSGSGYFNTSGYGDCFFGEQAGINNTTGNNNSFVGHQAGDSNTTGGSNSFFGREAGSSNTVETGNTLIGAEADLDPGADPVGNPVRYSTAIGYRAWVSRANSLVLGAVNGFLGVTTETFVGIGTPSPDRQLVVEGSQALGKFRRFNTTGPDFGPAFLFERARGTNTAPASILPGDYLGKVQFRGRVGGNMPEYGALVFIASDTNQNGRFSFVDRDLVTERMVVLNTGNVGIGTNAPTERLDVNGNLRVRGSILYGAPAVQVPDYVFEPDYRLMPLSMLADYLAREKHLPNIPSAAEIQANGVNVGELQMQMLEKIEELTLHTIAQARIIDGQKEEVTVLRQKAASQEERISTLEEIIKRLEAVH